MALTWEPFYWAGAATATPPDETPKPTVRGRVLGIDDWEFVVVNSPTSVDHLLSARQGPESSRYGLPSFGFGPGHDREVTLGAWMQKRGMIPAPARAKDGKRRGRKGKAA